MRTLILLTLIAHLQMNNAFMTLKEFKSSNLLRCYDTNAQDNRRPNQVNINGQFLPLPSSTETFVSLIERYESLNPNDQPKEVVRKLLKSFSMDDLNTKVKNCRDMEATQINNIRRVLFAVREDVRYDFKDEDFTNDEKCALHFMLSHTVNDTRRDGTVQDVNEANKIIENGVVSLYSDKMHAFSLGRVLLGIYAGFQFTENQDVSPFFPDKKDDLQGVKANLVYSVTIGDLVTRLIIANDDKIIKNGLWTDTSCPTEYRIQPEDSEGFVTYSELRGAVDGLLLGKAIQENLRYYSSFRLSQILRQYYGPISGPIDSSKPKWCNRDSLFSSLDVENEMMNYFKIFSVVTGMGSIDDDNNEEVNKMREEVDQIKQNIFRDIDRTECTVSQTSLDRKFVSPRNIFAIIDYTPTKLEFQAEVIGNLSSDFSFRPRGSLMGVYSNLKPLQQNTLDVIAKNSGTAGCPACFAKYFSRNGNKEDDAELLRDLNDTLTSFDEEQQQLEGNYQSETKAGSPGKVVLYFNFGNPPTEYRIQEALWDLKRHFRGVTILAIGNNREGLTQFVENEQTDIFTISAKTSYDLKERINKVPAEYTYRDCNQSNPSKEASNKQVAYIPVNKVQYWAMYPQYFLKSYWITMKFTPQHGAGIRVCFTRWYGALLEGKNENCKDSSSGEIEFTVSNPCYKKTVLNCDPFFFSVEGKSKRTDSQTYCQSLRCSTPQDIEFEFEHQGISCNIASYVSVSSLALLLAAVMYYLQKQ